MENWQQIVLDITNAGTITEDERDEILLSCSITVDATFKNLHHRYNISGDNEIIKRVFYCMLKPYIVFHGKLNLDDRQKKRIYSSLALTNKVQLIELLGQLERSPEDIYRNHDKEDVKRIISWIRKSFEGLYLSCHTYKDGRMYTTNMYLPEIEKWMQKLEIEYIPETKKLQQELSIDNNLTQAPRINSGDTLQTNLNEQQLAKLHKALISKGYIAEIKENDFIYWFEKSDNLLSSIEPLMQNLFLEKEAKAKDKNGEWDSKIRCAAFCELLWDNKYLGEKKHRINQCNAFAKSRYFDITNQLQHTKIKERQIHKNKLAYLFK